MHELRPYLRTAVRRLAIDGFHSARRRVSVADPEIFDVIANPDGAALPKPDDWIDIATACNALRRVYETLPDRWQHPAAITGRGAQCGLLRAQITRP